MPAPQTDPDPLERLTAFALNELDPAERAAVEAQLSNDPDARRYVDDIRQTAAQLEGELKQERLADLASAAKPVAAPAPRPNRFLIYAMGAAASVIIAAAVWQSKSRPQAHVLACKDPQIVSKTAGTISPVVPNSRRDFDKSLSALRELPPNAAALKPSDPKSKDMSTIKVPPDIIARAQIGDHFESINLDRADTQSAYGNPEARVFHNQRSADESKSKPQNAHADIQGQATPKESAQFAGNSYDFKKRGDGNGTFGGKPATPAPIQGDPLPTPSPSGAGWGGGNINGIGTDTPHQPMTETYNHFAEGAFFSARTTPLSTFSADVDTASYSLIRRNLNANTLPQPDAVRVEELINYFKYTNVPKPLESHPFGVNVESAACPWNRGTRLVSITVKAKGLPEGKRPQSNLVFLIDVSGSMGQPNRLPLVKEGLEALVEQLGAGDRVSIVTYAGNSSLALPSTDCAEKEPIRTVIRSLTAGGSTNGGGGIQMAYATAKQHFIKGGVNRVILATDGDFNVGIQNPNELVALIESVAKDGVFLTALGYGMGNLKDATLQRIANKGNGNYAFIDNAEESRKVLIEQLQGTLVTVAKDVKFQVEFNPAQCLQYRLIGYEKRALAAQDFNNDAKDAGEVGAGHTVTAFYEIVSPNGPQPSGVDALRYQPNPVPPVPQEKVDASPELLTLKIRYKDPEAQESKKLEFAYTDKGANFDSASADFRFGAAVALFGQALRKSTHIQAEGMRRVIELAEPARGNDEGGYRREFIQLVRKAAELRGE